MADRGEGANHAILDVLDFKEILKPFLTQHSNPHEVNKAIAHFYARIADRTRPAVLASRRACLDAHDYARINVTSPLLSKREMMIQFGQEQYITI